MNTQSITITISAQQIKQAGSSPVVLVPAPGAGQFIVPMTCVILYRPGRKGFTFPATHGGMTALVIHHEDEDSFPAGTVAYVEPAAAFPLDMTGTQAQIVSRDMVGFQSRPLSRLDNKALVLSIASEVSPFEGHKKAHAAAQEGDGALVITLDYVVMSE